MTEPRIAGRAASSGSRSSRAGDVPPDASTSEVTVPGTPGRRERNKAVKRARILASAQALLSHNGYERMTMAQVARDADVAMGTVFQYAATKAELLMFVTAERWKDAVPDAIEQARHCDGPAVAVRRLLRPMVEVALAEPENSAAIARELLFGAAGTHREQVVTLVQQVEDAVADVLGTAGLAEDAATAARMVVSGVMLEVNRTRTGRASEASINARLDAIVRVVSRPDADRHPGNGSESD